ncbi:MAG TPA: response regulator [Anaerolineae bacterium]|nr:response regulator [Anaerolineae bacterium]
MNKPQTILIVDDQQDNLRLLVNILKNRTYTVRPTRNAYQGLMIAQQEAPDLILLDIKMPEMDGYEVCRQLKADERTRDIPIIFLSALDDVDDKLQAFEAGGVDYVSKPFYEAELLARIETHLTLRHLQQALQIANETLDSKVRLRTEELAEANRQLQAEIERRIRHQQEKDRLLTAVSRQSEQLRAMTTWLVESQQKSNGAAIDLYQEIRQDITLAQSNLEVIQSLLAPDSSSIIANHLENSRRVLEKVAGQIEQARTSIHQAAIAKEELTDNPLLMLSTREREVLQLMVEGKTNVDIANLLSVTPATVYTYSKRIRNKLDIPDLPGLIKFAMENNLSA